MPVSRWKRLAVDLALLALLLSGAWGLGRGIGVVVLAFGASTAHAASAVILAVPEAIGFSGNITQGGTKIAVSTSTTVLAANAQRHAYCVKAKKANTQPVHCELGATSTTDSMEYDASSGWCDGGANGVVYAGPISCLSADGSAQNVFVWSY